MTLTQLSRILGYGVSLLAAGAGVLVLIGRIIPPAPVSLRYSFGVVLVCYGIYRFFLVRTSQRRQEREGRERRYGRDERDR